MKPSLAHHPAFLEHIGRFHGAWASAELSIDFTIGKLLKVSHEEAHLLTAGLEFNRKARLLSALLSRSDHPGKASAIHALRTMQNESKRNVLAHSYIRATDRSVTYVDRSRGGVYNVTEHSFTLTEIRDHVDKFARASVQLAKGYRSH